ncbi:nuclease-related domain-containing protein [Bacillus sp. JJ864]|uniref:nuclease-related domain-containing protein n=1 Tax=Bacillus sp. JJ864 TaxID=3122975 RepID=UPI002FFFDCFC
MIYIISLLCIVLGITTYLFYWKGQQLYSRKQQLIHSHKNEIAATVTDFENQKQNIHIHFEEKHAAMDKDYQNKILNLKQQYIHNTTKLENSIQEMSEYIKDLHKNSTNAGEIITHQLLKELKKELVEQKIISPSEMYIMPNIFVPYPFNGELRTRQIDHLVLLPTGVYVIETKYWRGKIVHGLTTQTANPFSFIIDAMSKTKQDREKEQTLVFVPSSTKDENGIESTTIQVRSYGEPTTKAKRTTKILYDYLTSRHGKKISFIKPIVYFGYTPNANTIDGIIDLSPDTTVPRLNGSNQLKQFFKDELSSTNKRFYNPVDLEEVNLILENINYRLIE